MCAIYSTAIPLNCKVQHFLQLVINPLNKYLIIPHKFAVLTPIHHHPQSDLYKCSLTQKQSIKW